MTLDRIQGENNAKLPKSNTDVIQNKHKIDNTEAEVSGLAHLQDQIGNRAIQRLLVQRSEEGPTNLDDDTANRINQARSGGKALNNTVQKQMSQATGHDLSGVRVHTSSESNELNRQLGAKAFTTGQDIFFREGAYDPHSSGGQELIAHELTHVVQQSTGAVGSSGNGMTVNAPGDAFEQEADAVAKQVVSGGGGAEVQRQEVPEEEEALQTKALQRQEGPAEEEELQQ